MEPRRDPMLDFAVKDTWRIFRIMGEFVEGFETLSQVKGVAIFGSARSLPGSADYQRAEEMGRALARAGYAVITGGGPGDMEAANKGALEAGGESVGLAIELPYELKPNPYLTRTLSFSDADPEAPGPAGSQGPHRARARRQRDTVGSVSEDGDRGEALCEENPERGRQCTT